MSLFLVSYCQFWLNLLFFNLHLKILIPTLLPTCIISHVGNKVGIKFQTSSSFSYYLAATTAHQVSTRESPTTHSVWLDCSKLMSDFCGRSREFIKACFCLKTHRSFPLSVLGNRSKTLLLPNNMQTHRFDDRFKTSL